MDLVEDRYAALAYRRYRPPQYDHRLYHTTVVYTNNFNINHTNTRGKGFYRGLGNTVSEQVLACASVITCCAKAFVSTSGLPLHAIAGSMKTISTYCFCTGWLL